MANMPIYSKNLLKIFSRTRSMTLGLVCSIVDVGSTKIVQMMILDKVDLDLLKSRSNLLPNTFKWEKF